MFRRLFNRNTTDLAALMQGHFVEAKALYAVLFDAVPCVTFIGELDVSPVFAYLDSHYIGSIRTTYQHAYFDHSTGELQANNTIFVLNSKRLIELGPNYVQVLHSPAHYNWAHSLVRGLSQFRIAPQEPVIGFAWSTAAN